MEGSLRELGLLLAIHEDKDMLLTKSRPIYFFELLLWDNQL